MSFGGNVAWACGGFFCSGQQIDQSGERVLFVVEDGHVEAHIQIQFEGTASDFSWVVPVSEVPTFDVGSDEAFTALLSSTVPRFMRDTRYVPGCEPDWGGDADADADSDADGDSDADVGGAVTVVSSGVAGPYATVVVDSEDPDALVRWLEENEYDVGEGALPIIASYVNAGFYFAGLKLQNDRSVGDLRPIVLDIPTDEPCLPIRLTSIAATPNMPIIVWVLADAQAVSLNYPELWLNDLYLYAADDGDYGDLANRALDEIGGRGFLVDYAGSPADARSAMNPDRYDTDRLATITDPRELLHEVEAQGLLASPKTLELLQEYVPIPESYVAEEISPAEFYACVDCGLECWDDEEGGDCWQECDRCYGDELVESGYELDAPGLAAAIEREIVEPLQGVADALSRHSKLTRLYTTMSPSEMTEDPIFATNPDLPDVPTLRSGLRTFMCSPDSPWDGTGQWDVVTPNGVRACIPSAEWGDPDDEMPAALLAIQQTGRGAGRLIADNRDDVNARYRCSPDGPDPDPDQPYVPGSRFVSTGTPWSQPEPDDGGLCNVGTASPRSSIPILAALALLFAWLRRKARHWL